MDTEDYFEGGIELSKRLLMAFGLLFMAFTIPVWILPYLIYKRYKKASR
jgi:hypothetical protein